MRRTFKAVTIVVLLVTSALGGFYLWQRFRLQYLDLPAPPPFDFRAARESYPYSVIPGGAYDWMELQESVKRDPVVRKHLGDMDPARVWAEMVRQPMQAYVSYRKGESIYWTDHPVRIAQGEVLLTDGRHFIRARCGNRVELKKPTPLPGRVPPPEPPPPEIAFETPMPGLIPPTILSPPLLAARITQYSKDPRYWRPPVWCCGFTPRLPSIPEPGTMVLVGTGVVGLARFFKRRKT